MHLFTYVDVVGENHCDWVT